MNGHVKFVVNKMRERSGQELQLEVGSARVEVADFGDSESRPVAHTMTRPRLQRKGTPSDVEAAIIGRPVTGRNSTRPT